MPLSDKADALFRFIDHGRAGFIDRQGQVVVPPTLRVGSNWGQAFYDGLLSLGVSDGPFIDATGQQVIGKELYRLWDFSEGLAAALPDANGKWGYVDHSGQFVIPPQFPFYPNGLVNNFSDGLAAVEIDGKLGYIDRSGQFTIPRRFVAGTAFEDGMARVVVEGPCAYSRDEAVDPCVRMSLNEAPATGRSTNRSPHPPCKWRFIDKTGNQIVPGEFEGAMGFHEGLAAVKIRGLWGFIDVKGLLAIPPRFRSVYSFSDGLALVEGDTQSGFIDRGGELEIPVAFNQATPFSEGFATVTNSKDHYIFIDVRGKQAIPGEFALASRFFHGLAHVKLGDDPRGAGTFAYIDSTGKRVFTYRR